MEQLYGKSEDPKQTFVAIFTRKGLATFPNMRFPLYWAHAITRFSQRLIYCRLKKFSSHWIKALIAACCASSPVVVVLVADAVARVELVGSVVTLPTTMGTREETTDWGTPPELRALETEELSWGGFWTDRVGGGWVVASTEDWDAMILEASRVERREDKVTGRVVSAVVDPELEADVTVTSILEVVEDIVEDVEVIVELLEENLLDVVELELRVVKLDEEAVEVADVDDVGGELGYTPTLSALIMSAAYVVQLIDYHWKRYK